MKKLFLITIILLNIFLISCSSTQEIVDKDIDKSSSHKLVADPQNIDKFNEVKEGDLFRFYFTFNDRTGHDGLLFFKIVDESKRGLYAANFDVKSDQFFDYVYGLTGVSIGKAYEWKIPYSKIQKGTSGKKICLKRI